MNALRKTAEQKVGASASKQVAKPRRGKDQHAMARLKRASYSERCPRRCSGPPAAASVRTRPREGTVTTVTGPGPRRKIEGEY